MKRRLTRWGIILLLNLVLIGGLLEILTRLTLTNLLSDRFIEPHTVLGHFHIPNRTGTWYTPDNTETQVTINSHGLHDAEHPYEKPAATQRVLILGDSFVEALQVNADQNFAYLLEGQLTTAQDQRVEVINGGVLAYGTSHALRLLQTEGLKYQPDVVVYVFYSNDVRDSSESNLFIYNEAGELIPQTRTISLTDRLRPHLYDYSYLFRLGITLYDSQQRLNDTAMIQTDWRAIDPIYGANSQVKGWNLVGDLLAEMHTTTQAENIPLLVVYMPDYLQVQDEIWGKLVTETPLDRTAPNDTLAQLIPEGVQYVDLLPIFQEQGQGEGLHLPNDGHLTPAGHELVAESLAPLLAEILSSMAD